MHSKFRINFIGNLTSVGNPVSWEEADMNLRLVVPAALSVCLAILVVACGHTSARIPGPQIHQNPTTPPLESALPDPARGPVSTPSQASTTGSQIPTLSPTSSATPDPANMVWVTNTNEQTLLRINAQDNSVTAGQRFEAVPFMVASGDRSVWVATFKEKTGGLLLRIDPYTLEILAGIELPGQIVMALATGHGSLWVGVKDHAEIRNTQEGTENSLNGGVARIDLASNRVTQYFNLGMAASDIAVTEREIWVLGTGYDRTETFRIDPRLNRANPYPLLDATIRTMEVDAKGYLWAANWEESLLYQLDASNHRVIQQVEFKPSAGAYPVEMAAGENHLWILLSDGNLACIVTSTGQVVAVIPLGNSMSNLSVQGGLAWIVNQEQAVVYRVNDQTNTVAGPISIGNPMAPPGLTPIP